MTQSRLAALCARVAVVFALTVLLAGGAVAGDAFYDVTVGLRIGDDARFFLNLTNQHYVLPSQEAVTVLQRCPHPADDFPVIAFLARASGRPANDILVMRVRGLSWSDILFDLHVSPRVLFVGMDREPGPPYGKAWGHWKNHKRQPQARFLLPDAQIVDLAKLQIAASSYRVSPYTIISERQRGVSVERFAVAKGRSHGAAPAEKKAGSKSKKEKPRGQGHGRGQQ